MLLKKHIAKQDTDVRDKMMDILSKHGMVKNGTLMQESVELDEGFKVGDKVKAKKGSQAGSFRQYETKVGTIVKDYKDGDFKVNFGGSNDASIAGKDLVKESVDLEEKNVPTNPKLWAKFKAQAKAKFDVYPSVRKRMGRQKSIKAAGGGWKTTKESKEMKSFFSIRVTRSGRELSHTCQKRHGYREERGSTSRSRVRLL